MQFSEEHKRNLSLSHTGHKHSDKTKEKISKSHVGIIPRKGFKHSNETKLKMSLSAMGDKNHKYIKDRTKLKTNKRKHQSPAYVEWKKNVEKRDNHKCKLNNDECNGRLEIHHIYNWIDYPNLRYLIENGITLCHYHHPIGRKKENLMISEFVLLLKNKTNEKIKTSKKKESI